MNVEEHVLVFYDLATLEPRIVVVNEYGEDGSWMVNRTDCPEGMGRVSIPKREVQGKSFNEMASIALAKL